MAQGLLHRLWAEPPALDASLFCLAFSFDHAGRLALLHIFHALPRGVPQDFYIVNFWRSGAPEVREYRERVEVRDADGRVLGALETTPFRLGGPHTRHTSLIRCQGLVLSASCAYEVWIALLEHPGGQEVARHVRLLEAG